MMKRVAAFAMIIPMLLCTGCTSRVYIKSGAKKDDRVPYASFVSSAWRGIARGKYTISASGVGLLCSGNAYCYEKDAVANPVEIYSAGYDIVVKLADDSIETVTLTAGDEELISCDSGSFKGYLYVVVG